MFVRQTRTNAAPAPRMPRRRACRRPVRSSCSFVRSPARTNEQDRFRTAASAPAGRRPGASRGGSRRRIAVGVVESSRVDFRGAGNFAATAATAATAARSAAAWSARANTSGAGTAGLGSSFSTTFVGAKRGTLGARESSIRTFLEESRTSFPTSRTSPIAGSTSVHSRPTSAASARRPSGPSSSSRRSSSIASTTSRTTSRAASERLAHRAVRRFRQGTTSAFPQVGQVTIRPPFPCPGRGTGDRRRRRGVREPSRRRPSPILALSVHTSPACCLRGHSVSDRQHQTRRHRYFVARCAHRQRLRPTPLGLQNRHTSVRIRSAPPPNCPASFRK